MTRRLRLLAVGLLAMVATAALFTTPTLVAGLALVPVD
jgi:hypothetical protein